MKSIQRQNKKTIHWGVLTFLMGAGLLFNANHAKAETVDSSPSHLGTFEESTTFTTSSHTGVQPTLAIEMKSPYGSGSYYETRSGSLTLKDTQEGATIKNATLKGQTVENLSTYKGTEYYRAYNNYPSFDSQERTLTHKLEANKKYIRFVNVTHYEPNGRSYLTMYDSLSDADGTYQQYPYNIKSTGVHISYLTPSADTGVDYLLNPSMDYFTSDQGVKIGISWVMIFEYQEGMENWNISYFEGTQSVQTSSLTITGKNLVDNSRNQYKDILLDSGIETTPNTCVVTDYIPYNPALKYTASLYVNGSKLNMVTWRYYDENKKYQGATGDKNTRYVRLRYFKGSDVTTDDVLFQLEAGSQATSYTPFQSQVLKFSELLTLRSNGKVFDEIDLMTGKFTQRLDEKNEVLTEPIVRWVKIQSAPIFGQIKQADLSITGEILPTIVSVTVPTAPLSFVLNPNEEPDRQFIASEFSLTNDSQVPITIELKEFVQLTDTMEDVSPDYYDNWEDLDLAASKRIALGLVPQASESWDWYHPGTYYVADVKNKVIGRVKRKSTVDFKFTALHGQAFGYNLSPQYRLTFVFDF